jgi:hypothetical protein
VELSGLVDLGGIVFNEAPDAAALYRKMLPLIKNLMAPKTVKQVRSFLGMVNYYKDMWRHGSHLLAPLTNLTSNKDGTVGKKRGPIKWEKVHQEAFNKIKQAITDDVMLSFPDFNKPFEIHTDASDFPT